MGTGKAALPFGPKHQRYGVMEISGMVEFKYEASVQTLMCVFSQSMDSVKSIEVTKTFEQQMSRIPRGAAGGAPGSEGASQGSDGIKVVFDLAKVNYISSAFIRLCISAAKSVGERNFCIIKTSPDVRKIFQVARLDKALNVS